MRASSSRDGFVVVELLIDAVAVVALVAIPAMFAYQSANHALGASASRTQAHYRAMTQDLENLFAHQAIHYADEAVFASTGADLHFTSSAGVEISVVASSEGWRGTATHEALGADEGCAVFVGSISAPTHPVTPPRPGEVACTE